MGRLIDADKLSANMYHEAFEKDSDMQKWDSGCWIRYKMFENVLKAQPTVEVPDINVGNMDIICCKDCAYCDSDVVDIPYGMTKKIWWCDRLYAGANENLIVEPDGFCSFAERREDETD